MRGHILKQLASLDSIYRTISLGTCSCMNTCVTHRSWVHLHSQVMIQVIVRISALLHLVDKKQHASEHLKIIKPELSQCYPFPLQCMYLPFHQDTAGKGGWTLSLQYLGLPSYKEIHFLLPNHLDHRPLRPQAP